MQLTEQLGARNKKLQELTDEFDNVVHKSGSVNTEEAKELAEI